MPRNDSIIKTICQDNNNQETILNCVADGIFTIDKNKKICFFNRSAERITGFTAKEAIGRPCCEIFRTNICDKKCTLEKVRKSKGRLINEPVKILDKNGQSILVSISASVLKDKDGNIIGGVETFRDLTVEEKLRQQLTKSFSFHDIISRSPRMHDLFAVLPDIGLSNASALVEGESGTGKELFARAIHDLSPRKNKPFIAVNCGSLPDTLLESELFGYKKGAFTDAKKDKPGRFAIADGGTLFLDEIGDISPALQVRFLRVLQEKTYEPLGAVVPSHADVRIIAATNKKLLDQVHQGKFREDLYYRLNVLRIELPPLRERLMDVPLLIDHFKTLLSAQSGKEIKKVDESVIELLMNYDFPGNVRELENIIHHAVALCRDAVIQIRHLPGEMIPHIKSSKNRTTYSLEDIEKATIQRALESSGGKKSEAAKNLGIDPSTLYRKMKRYKILF